MGDRRGMSERDAEAMGSPEAAAIIRSADDAILSQDLRGIIRSWNRSAERIFGYSAAEAVGKSITMPRRYIGNIRPKYSACTYVPIEARVLLV